jgi:hypothetical protein
VIRRSVLAASLAVLAAAVPGSIVRGQTGRTPPARGLVAPAAQTGVVGSQTCRGCHAATHSSWSNGRHSRMIQVANPASVIPPFTGTISLHGKDYRLEREGDAYFVVETYLQAQPAKRRVDYTLGSRRVQHYLSRLEDGRIVVLPPSYDVEKKEWFHNLDIVDFEESGAVKVQVWNSNCWGCHVSGEEKNFDPATKTWATTWTDFGTSCERCHGPGAAHAAKYAKEKKGEAVTVDTRAVLAPDSTADRDTLIVHPRRLDAERSTMICAQCHSLRDVTRTGFTGGDSYYDFFTPLLEYVQKRNHDPAWWPNGRPRRFSSEGLAFWESQCFVKGKATCVMCHTDVHEPDIDKNPPLAQKRDASCTGCHADVAALGEKHTHHAATAKDVSCVSCHMPRTVISLRHRMPDHTISVPAPENTKRFGIPNACNECHKDKDAAWSEAKLADWFPNGRRRALVEDAKAFTLGAAKDPKGLAPLIRIAGDVSRAPLIRANALGYLRDHTEPGALRALLTATTDAHPAIRLAGFLGLAERGGDPAVRTVLERGVRDERRTVRMAAALGLLNAGVGRALPPSLAPAIKAALDDHEGRARFLNEIPSAQLDLGKMQFLAGNWKEAEASVRDALRLDPKIAGGQYFLGLATLGQGRVAEGAALLRGVDRKDPHRQDADAVLAKLPKS